LTAILCAALAFPALAQTYPSRTVRIIVPHPAGGPGDVPPRGLAQELARSLGQPFVIENREGADGLIGAEAAAKSAPDGYTLISTSSGTMVINPSLRAGLSYSLASFTPIIHTGTLQQLILGSPSTPGNTMKEMLDAARANPDKITIGTFGNINLASVFYQWAKSEGASLYPIPYKSASQSLQAALAGQVNVISFAAGPGTKLVQAGKLKVFAISPSRNNELLPNTPSLREAGVNFDLTTWWGWFAPAGTSRDVIQRLNGEVGKAIKDPTIRAKFFASQGLAMDAPAGGSVEEFAAFIKKEAGEFGNLVKTLGLKAQ
jgi:tripartite-type tricarboxylate transporter receptor subunit TctC